LEAGESTIAAAVALWYDEESQYNFQAGQYSDATGHFTQLVWKGSSTLGCAFIPCNTASTPGYYLMCEYSPAGNVIGEFTENVFSASY